MKKRCGLLLAFLLLIGCMAVPISAATDPVIAISGEQADPGDTVKLTVSLRDNPGITVMRLQLQYDETVLTLVDVKDADRLGKSVHSKELDANPYVLYWNNTTSKVNFKNTGDIVTLTFEIADDARYGEYAVDVTFDEKDILDKDMESVAFRTETGRVAVSCDPSRTEWRIKKPDTCLEKGVQALTCRDCGKEMDTRDGKIGAHAVKKWTVDVKPTTKKEGKRHGYCTVCEQEITETLPKQVTSVGGTVSPDSATGPEIPEEDRVDINVETNDDVTLPGDVELHAQKVELYGQEREVFSKRVAKAFPDKQLVALYDVVMLSDGQLYRPDGAITASIRLSDNMQKQYNEWLLVRVNEDDLSVVEAVVKDGALQFETDALNCRYALLGVEKTTIWQSVWFWIVVAVVLLIAAAVVYTNRQHKRKKARK